MLASVGPTHGVHATAKARPAMTGPPAPARLISASGRHSWLKRGTKSVQTKKTPRTTISQPAIRFSVSWWSCSVEPMPVADIPKATNMIVNDRQKMIAGPRTLPTLRSSPRISSIVTPEIALR